MTYPQKLWTTQTTKRADICLAWLFVIASFLGNAWAQDRITIISIEPLLRQAILDGRAYGTMKPEIVQSMYPVTQSHEPINVDVVDRGPIKSKPDCRKLDVTSRQNDVLQPGRSVRENVVLTYSVGFCRDGRYTAVAR